VSYRASSVFVLCLCISLNLSGQSKAPPKVPVEYVINVFFDPRLTGEAVHDLRLCLPGGCREEQISGQALDCPPGKVCEIVEVKEFQLQGNGYKYVVTSTLTNNPNHKPVHEKPITFPTATKPEQARDSALRLIRLYILCHDQLEHNVLENAPRPANCECE